MQHKVATFSEVIVGIDFAQGGVEALRLAQDLLAPDGRLTLTYVVMSDPRVFGAKSGAERAGERDLAHDLLDRERRLMALDDRGDGPAAADRIGLRVIEAASPARGLSCCVRERQADLLVVGASRRRGPGRILAGDDTRALLRRPPCPVAVAPVGYVAGWPPRVGRPG